MDIGAGTEVDKEEPIPILTPFKLGPFQLSHRVVYASLSRSRSVNNVPDPHAILYYSQRASPGGLILSEGTVVSPTGHGFPLCPGLYTKEQVEAWKPIVKAVHDNGAYFFSQLWHVGRRSHHDYQPNKAAPISGTSKRDDGATLVLKDYTTAEVSTPRQLTTDEIPKVIEEYRIAARNAMEAGFDAVELLCAYSYLPEDFMIKSVNDRTDQYGPQSLESRARFVLELADAVIAEVGSAQKVGVRLSPFWKNGTDSQAEREEFVLYLLEQLNRRSILYVNIIEPKVEGEPDIEHSAELTTTPFRKAFKGAYIGATGFTKEKGNTAISEGRVDLVAFGRVFLANPDLPKRFALNAPLNKYNSSTFSIPDPVVGYTDYPLLED
ncbi:unnamed protein product [Calypogeia fissa]